MKRTGVFATEEELADLKKLATEAASTPVMALSVGHGLSTGGFAGEAHTRAKKAAHECALAHGLPEITGYYGVMATGEFVET